MTAAALAAPAVSVGQETSATKLQRAIKLTAERKLPEAEVLYKDIAAESPAEAYPLLARFYSRTGNTSAAVQLLSSAETTKLTPLTRGRIAVSAQMPDKAVEVLRLPAAAGEFYQQTALLATQLNALGRTSEASDVLTSAVVEADLSQADRLDLFRRLARLGNPEALKNTLPLVSSILVTSSTTPYPSIREIAVEGLAIISSTDAYADLHSKLVVDGRTSPVAAWLAALSHIKRGDDEAARAALRRFTGNDSSISPREKAVLYEEAARLSRDNADEARKLYEQIVSIVPDPDRVRLTMLQLAFKQKDLHNVLNLTKQIDVTKLDDVERLRYANARVASEAAVNGAEAAMNAYEQQAKGLTWEARRELAEAPLVTLTEPKDQEELRNAIRNRLKSDAGASPDLYVLLMSAENATHNMAGVMAALQKYTEKRPQDLKAMQELGDATAAQAAQVAEAAQKAGGPEPAPPAEEMKDKVDAAARSLWELVQTKPYEPEAYGKLMSLYTLYGQPEKALKVPEYLLSATSPTAEMVHLAGYLYLGNGYPEQAIPVFERAIRMDPQPRYRLNYAHALTRVGRLEDADKILREFISKGYHKRQYHVHEVYETAFRVAQQQDKADEFVAFLKSLINKPDVPQHSTFLLDAGKLMISRGRADDSIPFFEAVQKQYPDRKDEATDALIQASIAKKDFAQARKLIESRDANTTDPKIVVDKRYNLAELQRAEGDTTGAIKMWIELGQQYPKQSVALRGMLQAARLLADNGERKQARKVLENLTSMHTGDVDAELAAREMMMEIRPSTREEAQELVGELATGAAATTAP